MTISRDIQKPFVGQLVTLFELDCTHLPNGLILYFTSSAYSSSEIRWNGKVYTPIEIEAEGFEMDSQSAFPTPKLRLTNVTSLATSLVVSYGDMIGSQVRRIRTFAQYLDDGDTPDPTAIFMPDVYVIEQKTSHTNVSIEWKLSVILDQQGIQIPSFQLVRDYCSHVFRYYDPIDEVMKYERATCPYTGSYYTIDNVATSDPLLDRCPKTLEGCKKRFGARNNLPYKGCPGLARFR